MYLQCSKYTFLSNFTQKIFTDECTALKKVMSLTLKSDFLWKSRLHNIGYHMLKRRESSLN